MPLKVLLVSNEQFLAIGQRCRINVAGHAKLLRCQIGRRAGLRESADVTHKDLLVRLLGALSLCYINMVRSGFTQQELGTDLIARTRAFYICTYNLYIHHNVNTQQLI